MMKPGLGLYRHMLTRDNFRFARQIGATHIVAHLVDYFRSDAHAATDDQPTGDDRGWGRAGDPEKLWTTGELVDLRRAIEAEGLKLEAIENFDPAHWHDVLLDGPLRDRHLEQCKTIIRRLGEAGIPVMGYNFSLAGVACRTTGPMARGGAEAVGVTGGDDRPLPAGMVWNMVYNPDAPAGTMATVTADGLWHRYQGFLDALLPVAEEAGVTLAAHPDDPPFASLRGTPRLVHQPALWQRQFGLNPSPRNQVELCVGTLAEMPDADVYQAVDDLSRQQRVGYVHLRDVRGKVPYYWETFLDEGETDMFQILSILHRNGYDGVVIPDHTPRLTCAAPWHAGMAHALGWILAALRTVEQESGK